MATSVPLRSVGPRGAVGLAELVAVGGAMLICGKLQFARSRTGIAINMIMNGIILRFTFVVEIIIPA